MRLVGERRPAEACSSSGTGETIDACVSELERPLSMGESSGGAEDDAARAAGFTMTRSDAEEAAATELGVILDAEEAAATELGVIFEQSATLRRRRSCTRSGSPARALS